MTPTAGQQHVPAWRVAAAAVVAAFGTYFCMYAFRKPFTAATYDTIPPVAGFPFKVVLVAAQVAGYMVSKFVGIRFVAEVEPRRRVRALLAQVGLAEVALVLFAVTPPPFNAVWLFANGLMLGMIFGLVMGFLEGRRNTELLLAALCTSFIVADGAAKSVGTWLLGQGVPEGWMPAAAGGLFVAPLVACCGILNRVPPPDAADVAARAVRGPMAAADRRRFLARYGFGVAMIVGVYLCVTVVRSVRADFAPEVWAGLGVTPDPGLFTRSELVVAAVVLVLNGAMVVVRDNRTAFFLALGVCGLGLALTAAAVRGLEAGWLGPFPFMVLLGLGLYLPYIAIHTTVFERLMALTRDRGTIGYLMCLADAVGYLGYVGVLLARFLLPRSAAADLLPFVLALCTAAAVAGGGMLVPAALYFRRLRSGP